jgi:hypothetical protein
VIVVLLDFEMSYASSDIDDLGLTLPSNAFTLVRPSVSQMCCPLMNDLPHYCKCTPKTQVCLYYIKQWEIQDKSKVKFLNQVSFAGYSAIFLQMEKTS